MRTNLEHGGTLLLRFHVGSVPEFGACSSAGWVKTGNKIRTQDGGGGEQSPKEVLRVGRDS